MLLELLVDCEPDPPHAVSDTAMQTANPKPTTFAPLMPRISFSPTPIVRAMKPAVARATGATPYLLRVILLTTGRCSRFYGTVWDHHKPRDSRCYYEINR